MSKEAKTVFLAILTLVIYASTIAIQTGGSFVFPFPLNPFFFAAAAVYIAILNKEQRFLSITLTITALMAALSSPVTWEIVFSIESQETFYQYPWFYWFYFLYTVSIGVWGCFEILKYKKIIAKLAAIVGLSLSVSGLLFGYDIMIFSGFGLMMITGFSFPRFRPYNLLWMLLFVLESTKWINYLLN
jgi:hypothetical protein